MDAVREGLGGGVEEGGGWKDAEGRALLLLVGQVSFL